MLATPVDFSTSFSVPIPSIPCLTRSLNSVRKCSQYRQGLGYDGRSKPIQTCTITETVTEDFHSDVSERLLFGPFENDMENVAQR